MLKEKVTELFDDLASSYDEKWRDMAPINGALHLLAGNVLSELSADARILCVGAGTGAEILYFAGKFPGWHFTAVEPSAPMLEVFRARAEEMGIASRCTFHSGYLDSLQSCPPFDGATSFLVSQFIKDRKERIDFFQSISDRVLPGGVLISSDLAAEQGTPEYASLLEVWVRLTSLDEFSKEGVKRVKEFHERDVGVLPTESVGEFIAQGGFTTPIQFYQAGLIHAWYAKRASSGA